MVITTGTLAVAVMLALQLASDNGGDTDSLSGDGSVSGSSAAPDRRDDIPVLDAVIATAQKRSENVMEVPAAISVIGESFLETLNAGQLTDFGAYVPGFQANSGGAPGKTMMALRGVAPLGATAIIGTYIDDTPLGSSGQFQLASSYMLDLLPYDVQSVEVLRGPQGTLYGASAMGGLFKYITKSADPDSTEIRFGVDSSHVAHASDPATGVNAAVNLPLRQGISGLRASVSRRFIPGYIDNPVIGQNDYNESTQTAARLAFTWRLSDAAELRMQGLWQRVRVPNVGVVALDPDSLVPLVGDHASINLMQEPFRNSVNYYSATLDWDLGWADLVSATSYSQTRMSQLQDVSAMYGPLYPLFGYAEGMADFTLIQGLDKWTQELRLASRDDAGMRWLVGAFLTNEDASNDQTAFAYDMQGNSLPGVDPLALVALPNRFSDRAMFGDLTWNLTPDLDISIGARLSRNAQSYHQITSGSLLPVADAKGRSSETVWTYKLSSSWNLERYGMLYARVATGFRPGGPNAVLPDIPSEVEADRLTNYEIGWKSHLLDGRMSIEAAAYHIDWKDIQVIALTPNGVDYYANGGQARSRGLELTTSLRASEYLTLGFNSAWSDARLDENVPPSSGLLPHSRMPLTPEWSGALTLDYQRLLQRGWQASLGGGYRHVGERIGMNGFTMGSYRSLDLHAGLGNMTWNIRLFVRNAMDEHAFMTVAPIVNALSGEIHHLQGVLLQPRTIGLGLEYRY